MKNFDVFVDQTVRQWLLDKNELLAGVGLGTPSNWERGDSAENYILRKIKGISQNYIGKKSIASRSPADIFAVARRDKYWHVMLIQVKSSIDPNSIYKLSKKDQDILNEFGKYFKKQIQLSEALKQYKQSSFVISTGYAGVYKDEKNNRHYIKETKLFKVFNLKTSHLDSYKLKSNINNAHQFI
jgi:hypothetical protein